MKKTLLVALGMLLFNTSAQAATYEDESPTFVRSCFVNIGSGGTTNYMNVNYIRNIRYTENTMEIVIDPSSNYSPDCQYCTSNGEYRIRFRNPADAKKGLQQLMKTVSRCR